MKNALRVAAQKTLVVFMTFVLVMGTSPLMQVAHAEEQNVESAAELTVANQNGDVQAASLADSDADGAQSTDQQDADAEDATDVDEADAQAESAAVDESQAQTSGEDAISAVSEDDDSEIQALSEGQDDKPVSGKTYGKITYTQNTLANGFLSSIYDKYRDGGTSLGIANSFHIVAFDTLNAPVDVYGNILVKNLATITDMGTSQKFVDIYRHNTLSYIQNYSGTFPRWDKSENGAGCVVFGSGVDITTRNNSELLLNGTRIDSPNSVVQDVDTETAPFIDIDALKTSMVALSSSTLASRADIGASSELTKEGKVRTITIDEGYTGCAYVSLTAEELMSSYEGINIDGLALTSESGLVINVDCQGATSIDIPRTYLRINGQNVGIGETDSIYGDTGYVLYNFYNTAENLPISVHECTASVLAPNASLTLGPGSACGTFIANNVTVAAESHTRPFHGNLKPSDGGDDEEDFSLSGYSMRAADAPVSDADKVCYVDPKVVKVLDGRALKDGEFSFQLIDENGVVISTATNDAAGMVDFDRASPATGSDPDNPSCLSFTAPGTYTYTVRETPGQVKDSTVVYSTEVVQFITTIGVDENGVLYEVESHYVKYANADDAAAQKNGTTYSSSEHPTITNTVKPLSLALVKSDADTGAGLAGAVYALYRVDASAANGAVQVMTATSDANGLMVFTAADASAISEGGEYFFQEVSAPAGYTLSGNKTETFTIERADDGTYSLVYADGTVSKSSYAGTAADPIVFKAGEGVTDVKTSVTFGKVSSDGSALSGATLAIRDAAGEDVDTWTTGSVGHVVTGLSTGVEYTLYEKEAPAGYVKAVEVVFTIDEYGNVSIVSGAKADSVMNAYVTGATLTLIDYKRTEIELRREVVREEGITGKKGSGSKGGSLPQTGDASAALILAATAGGLVCMVAACTLWRRRKE